MMSLTFAREELNVSSSPSPPYKSNSSSAIVGMICFAFVQVKQKRGDSSVGCRSTTMKL